MIQVLTILRAMLIRHPIGLPTIGIGIALLAIDVLVLALIPAARGPRFSVVWLLLAGFWVALTFRELVSNRVLSLGCRYLAHRRLLRMDWCAIKPARADQYRTL